eukprot:CAMPEP_0118823086 /NCGR_PEP_ID=MMETSP1162-20130426/9639_1 /TAXON_ID=33656 /ORGANISM="Phaeocystis Sp, Strain CCMP2710" /LENGTH=60 /DNA_ID=CAMNT_0006753673 /DNA_START=88 /DNA_END=268 /DNA_ORIENTATION=+
MAVGLQMLASNDEHLTRPKVFKGSNQERVKRLEDGRGRGAAQAAGRVERVDAEQLVDEAA